jgi:hypothetical protein
MSLATSRRLRKLKNVTHIQHRGYQMCDISAPPLDIVIKTLILAAVFWTYTHRPGLPAS